MYRHARIKARMNIAADLVLRFFAATSTSGDCSWSEWSMWDARHSASRSERAAIAIHRRDDRPLRAGEHAGL